jgi:hypothetical protein
MYRGITVQIFVKGQPKGSKTITKMQIEIGEDDDSDIWLDDSDVEYHQANILLLPEGAFVEDHYSSEGTYLNGKRVKKPRPINEGDEIACGNSKVVVEKLLGEGAEIVVPPRFCSIKMLDKCPHCGGGLPVNGVMKTIPCSSCQQGVTFKDEYWKVMLEDLDNDYDQGGGNYTINMETNLKWRAERPKCVKCQAELQVDDVPLGTDHDIPCKSCGERNTTYPAPDFAKGVLPSLSQIYCGERGASGDGAAVRVDEDVKPTVLTCPNCRGSLSAGSRSERTINCQYCGSDVFLPDDLWSKLHPAKTAAKWYLRFDGKRPKDYEEEREAPRKLQEIRERMQTQKKARSFNPLSMLPFAGILIPVVIVAYSLLSGDGAGWSNEYLAPTTGQVGQTTFAINVPPSFTPRNESGGLVWSPPGIAPSYISVSPTAVLPRTPQEAMAQVQAQYKPNTQIMGAQPIAGGFLVTLKDLGHQNAEAQVYLQKVAAAAPGYPPQPVPGGPVLWCVAHFERPAGEGPMGDMEELLTYLSSICGSLAIY